MEHLVAAAIEEASHNNHDANNNMPMMGASSGSSSPASFAHAHDPHQDDDDDDDDGAQDQAVDDYQPPSPHIHGNNYSREPLGLFQQPSASAAGAYSAAGDGGAAAVGGIITWQAMFQQLKDFYDLGHRRVPPRMATWMNAQRRQYKMYGIGVKTPRGIITNRIRQLNSIEFEWHTHVVDENSNAPPVVVNCKGSPVNPRCILPPSHNVNGRGMTRHHNGGRGKSSPRKSSTKRRLITNDNSRANDSSQHVMMQIIHNRGYAKGQPWTFEEDKVIDRLQSKWGNKWSKISRELNNGRTDNDVKNRFNRKQRSRGKMPAAAAMGDDESEEEDEESEEEEEEEHDAFDQRRTGHVQSLVRAALAKDRGELSSSRRTRKPSRRVQESYNPLGANSDYEDDDTTSQTSGGKHHGNSYEPPKSQGLQRLESVLGGTKRKYFPDLLFRMVSECSSSEPHIIDWVNGGTAFQVKDMNLVPSIIERYFRHNKYSSLNRMLYLYGFKKQHSGEYAGAFSHPHFTKWSTRETLVTKVTKEGDSVEMPAASRTSSSSSKGGRPRNKQVPVSKSKQQVKYAKPGGAVGGVPKHALFSTKPSTKPSKGQQGVGVTKPHKGQQGVGAAHPNLLFNPPQEVTSSSTQPADESTSEVAAKNKRSTKAVGRTQPNDEDILLTLKNDKYKKVMFAQFRILGKKTGRNDDVGMLKRVAKLIFESFKTNMDKKAGDSLEAGRFLKKIRGSGKEWYEVADEPWSVNKISSDLRRRMESAKVWANDDGSGGGKKAPDYDEGNELQHAMHIAMASKTGDQDGDNNEKKNVSETKQRNQPAAAKLKPATSPSKASFALSKKERVTPNSKWNLGSHANSSEVQYFKSDIGEGWVEQIVPRKTVRLGGPDSDKYFLCPDGNRFRSMAEVQRFLESKLDLEADDVDHEDENAVEGVKNEDVSIAADDSHQQDRKPDDGDPSFTPCMCKKSKCLKLYCDCFNKEKYCSGCYCIDCRNTPRYDAQRGSAIADILKRNPVAFKPKVKTTIECKCKRTACLKKYCDCFVHGVYCGPTCQCRGCENLDPIQLQQKRERQEESEYLFFAGHLSSLTAKKSDEPREEGEKQKLDEAHEWTSPEKPTFPELLHDLVTFVNAEDPSVISWMPDGEVFCIHDQSQETLGPYVSKYFSHDKWLSLQRQLNNYGFSAVGSVKGSYRHPNFTKISSKAELKSISRRAAYVDSAQESNKSGKKRFAESDAAQRPCKNPRIAAAQEDRGTAVGSMAAGKSGVTFICPKCSKDFHFYHAGTASASFSRHLKACNRQGKEQDTNVVIKKEPHKSPAKWERQQPRRGKSLSPQKVVADEQPRRGKSLSPQKVVADYSPQKQKSAATAEPVTFTCPKCSEDFVYGFPKTAAASFAHHVRACDPEKKKAELEKKQARLEKKKAKAQEKKDAKVAKALKSPGKWQGGSPRKSLTSQVSVEKKADLSNASPKTYTVESKTAPEPAASKKKPPPEPAAKASLPKPTTPKSTPTKPSASGKPHDDDVLLSLKNPRYKQIMFDKFKTLGKRTGGEENLNLNELKHEMFSFFKQGMGDDGRFLKSDRHMNDIWEVDDEDALEKIKMDLKRRNESSKHWLND